MTTYPETWLPADNDYEEPEDGALRHAIGVRPIFFRRPVGGADDSAIDDAPCPPWCLYNENGPWGKQSHEVNPERPFSAYHSLGTGPRVAASLYCGERHKDGPRHYYVEAAHLDIWAGQDGAERPEITAYLRAEQKALDSLGREGLKLSVADAKDLISALTYVVDVLEERRLPLIDFGASAT
jgi:hypothetical protein